MENEGTITTAFALAGLGGFNAHGAGFLDAVSECKVVPDLVTATSGQIVLLSKWLQGESLKESILNPDLEKNSMAQIAVGVSGEPGVFRPAYMEAFTRWMTPPSKEGLLEAFLNRAFPAQL